ncbi:MAG: hypothetical protein AAF658_03165, partial [Myxococcota bacterium]
PTLNTNPPSDPPTFEAASCADACSTSDSCSRRGGEATVVITAPADDGSTGNAVTSYAVHAVALETQYLIPGSDPEEFITYTSCTDADLTRDGPFEQTVNIAATADPGGTELATFSGLNLPRAYCFLVEAEDDLGNRSDLRASPAQRVIPWLTDVPGQAVADIFAFDPAVPDIVEDPSVFAYEDPTSGGDLGQRVQNVGDIDGDGLDDLVASAFTPSSGQKVAIFYSSVGDFSSPTFITGPSSSLFGWRVRGGNIDGVAPNDLVITSLTLDTSDGSGNGGASGGAVYIWWGANGGIRTDASTDARLPSINPDVAILGPAGGLIGSDVVVADVDSQPGDDIVFARLTPYGFSGGSRSRFPGSPPTPSVFYLDTSGVFTGSPAPQARPDLIIDRVPGNSGASLGLVAGNFDGDANGKSELVVIDRNATSRDTGQAAAGEAYVYEGGLVEGNIVPNIGPPVVAPVTQVLTHLGRSTEAFGQGYVAFPSPSGTGPDWLALASVTFDEVVLFRGVQGAPLEKLSTLLEPTIAVSTDAFGLAMCAATDPVTGGGTLMVTDVTFSLPSGTLARGYYYEWDGSALAERSILQGTRQFGRNCASLGTYVSSTEPTFLISASSDGIGVVVR